VAYLRRVLVNLSSTWHRNESSWRRRMLRFRDEPIEAAVPDPHLVSAVQRLPHRQRVVSSPGTGPTDQKLTLPVRWAAVRER
jgi:hypothetical protein